MRLSRVDLLLWAAGFLLNTFLLSTLWRCRRYRVFPVFTAIISLAVSKTVLLYLVREYGSSSLYFVSYWAVTVVDTLLQLCVVYELAGKVFRPLDVWVPDLRSQLLWWTSLSVGAAMILTWLASPPASTPLQALVIKGNLFAAALMSELFIAMRVTSLVAGLPWKSHAGAIAQGLGGYSLICVLIESGHAYLGITRGLPVFFFFSQVRMVAYLGCVLYWAVTLRAEEQPARLMTPEMHSTLSTLQTQLAGDLRAIRLRKS